MVSRGTQDAWALTASPSPQKGTTPLQYALGTCNEEMAKMLREAGAME